MCLLRDVLTHSLTPSPVLPSLSLRFTAVGANSCGDKSRDMLTQTGVLYRRIGRRDGTERGREEKMVERKGRNHGEGRHEGDGEKWEMTR